MKTITTIASIACLAISLATLAGCKTDQIEYYPMPGAQQANVSHYGGQPAAAPVNVNHYGPQPTPPAPAAPSANVNHYPQQASVNRSYYGGVQVAAPARGPVNVSHH